MAKIVRTPAGRSAGPVMFLILLSAVFLFGSCKAKPGTVYGEFHDKALYEKSVADYPEMKDWDDAMLWEDASGATIQAKTFGHETAKGEVWLNGKSIAVADGFGQFVSELAPGEYKLTGKCEGYKDMSLSLTVESDQKTYINFILEPLAD